MMIYTKSPKSKKRKVPKAQKEQYDAWLKSIATMSSGINSSKIFKWSISPKTESKQQNIINPHRWGSEASINNEHDSVLDR